jgi:hypothetical protein
MTGHLPIDGYNRENTLSADWEEMTNFDPQIILTSNPWGVFKPAEKVGDLRLSFFAYYYF